MSLIRIIAVALLAAAGVPEAFAQAYPSKPILWIIPYAQGGGADVIARPISIKLSQVLGQTIVYDNRGGAGGMVAGQAVAKAAPDGYTSPNRCWPNIWAMCSRRGACSPAPCATT